MAAMGRAPAIVLPVYGKRRAEKAREALKFVSYFGGVMTIEAFSRRY